MSPHVLEVRGLSVRYKRRAPEVVRDVSFALDQGRTLALVGESGSGKSTIGKAILGLAPITAGQVLLDGNDIGVLRLSQRRALAHQLQVVFQDPYGSLNPNRRIGEILSEPLLVRSSMSSRQVKERVQRVLDQVAMPSDAVHRFPGNFSGGQRQRIAIARALIVEPRVIICDEPTSALDVSTQNRVMSLLKELQASLGVAYLFVTHDLALVSEFADDVAVLSNGAVVENGSVSDVCMRPRELYTRALMAAAPIPDPARQRKRREERQALLERLRIEQGA